MTCALFIHSSPYARHAHAYQLGLDILDYTQRGALPATVIERDLTSDPLPPLDDNYATALTSGAAHTDDRFALSEKLISELESSDTLLLAMPMHNFSVPAAFKLWIDYVVRIHRSFTSTKTGKVGLLTDRPTTILVSSGGFHCSEHAVQPDFLSPYVKHVLATIGIYDVVFHYLEGLTSGESAVASALRATRRQLQNAGLLDRHNDYARRANR
ncbi:NAD(P)H-dependent oxidoreductase [Endozoicomonas sp. G2_2]|uniref:FMN-dependent NADH-azoreductase n=1 Tax=Endozoicomonas sp. G2_2 TaxID=2821092 RepID=UPI001ADA5B9B|nr:NAD(P)H-dependent oxidoreductase [Endozoicomonas sp. G2_2]MBO9471642.1 NAD(P)H-dependent oxidoreductase [Endozoicomonas sp. G2_2]